MKQEKLEGTILINSDKILDVYKDAIQKEIIPPIGEDPKTFFPNV